MYFNIKLSNQDWELFERSGYLDYEMFSHPGVEFPDIDTSFTGHHLKHMPSYCDYPSLAQAETAKEQLIRNLHIVRARIDDMKSSRGGGVDREILEI